MTTSEAIDVFKEYLTTKIVPRPAELIEASKIAIKVLTQQLEETNKYWKPSEEQIKSLKQARDYYMSGRIKYVGQHLNEIAEQLEKLM